MKTTTQGEELKLHDDSKGKTDSIKIINIFKSICCNNPVVG